MKYMKLGSKPDAFQADGKTIRYVASELATDITVIVGEVKFYLHKFPLLSKSSHLEKLVSKANEDNSDEITLVDFPGGPKAFEICAKFCYGMITTLNANNVVAARCAAEYLGMTEDVDRGNLIFKIEVFLNSSIFRSWKDSIIVLKTTKYLHPWSEDLKIVGRCIDSIASKTSMDPTHITWSYTNNRKLSVSDRITEEYREKIESVPKDWWVEDICELDVDVYKKLMIAVKSKGRMDGTVIGEALRTYMVRWLPGSVDDLVSDDHARRTKFLVETIVCLLPSDKGVGCSCSFLLKLLKVALLVGVDDSVKEELTNRISLKLHEASVNDLLIPARSPLTTSYDVDLVQSILNKYMLREKINKDLNSVEKNEKGTDHDCVLGHEYLSEVGKLIDGYLSVIASDPNLGIARFIEFAQSVPDSARPFHDGLYEAIDVYLKENPSLTKSEKKKLCGMMDVRKLSSTASAHAAQNDRLPLRLVVQVLYFEQVRVATSIQSQSLDKNPQATTNTDDKCKTLQKQMSQARIEDDEHRKNGKLTKKSNRLSKSGAQLLPSRSRRLFDKLWIVTKGHGDNRSTDTSGSSQSPTSMVLGDTKSSGLRNRRHSIS